MKWLIVFITFLFSLHRLSATHTTSPLLLTAERLFSEQLYNDASLLYEKILNQNEEAQTLVTTRLATCLLHEKSSEKSLDLLKTAYPYPTLLYLMSVAYRQTHQTQQALDLLQTLQVSTISDPPLAFIQLEKGFHYLQMAQWIQAEFELNQAAHQTDWLEVSHLAYIFLAKLAINQNQFDQAHQLLDELTLHFPLALEQHYLRGVIFFHENRYSQALACFKSLKPSFLTSLPLIYTTSSTLYQPSPTQEDLKQVEKLLLSFLQTQTSETHALLLLDVYWTQFKLFNDLEAKKEVEQLLNQQTTFFSLDSQRHLLFKTVELASSFEERCQLLDNFLNQISSNSPLFLQGYLLKGLNQVQQGIQTKQHTHFDQAILAFNQLMPSFPTLSLQDQRLVLKGSTLAQIYQNNSSAIDKAWLPLAPYLTQNPPCLEINCLTAWVALHSSSGSYFEQARQGLEYGRLKDPLSSWQAASLELEGLLALKQEAWSQADTLFHHLITHYPDSIYAQNAWFWRAYEAEKQKDFTHQQLYLKEASLQPSNNRYAALAYLLLYPMKEYMQGNRQAFKHLQAMPLLFPSHPLLIQAYYLIGLDYKKEHRDEKGRLIHAQDWIAAIDAFQAAESLVEELSKKQSLEASLLSIRWLAQLERAQANLAIAERSLGGKKHIYLAYAEKVFENLNAHLETLPYPHLWAETACGLAHLYQLQGKIELSYQVLDHAIHRFSPIPHYHLFKLWDQKGCLTFQQKDYEAALNTWLTAEKMAIDWSADERLNVWIQQSLCYQNLNQLEEAMRLLSKVINADVISSLRVKAMFLRATLYEMQGRSELALKQLEATARKGGEWAQKAKEKLGL
jgi:tetratricopeptide (TPR) repeat protein